MNSQSGRFLLSLMLCVLSGCVSNSYKAENGSGFLSSYEGMEQVESLSSASIWRWHSLDFSAKDYDNVFIRPLIFFPQPETNNQVSKNALEDIRSAVESVLLKAAISSDLPSTHKKGKKTLILRTAITSTATDLKAFSVREVIPARLIFAGAEMALGKRDKLFSLFFEYELVDSLSGKVMVRGVRQDSGNPLVNNKDRLSVKHAKPVLARLVQDLEPDLKILANDLTANE